MGIIGTRRSKRHVKIKVVEKLGNFPLRYLEADYVLHIEKNHLNNLSRKYTWIVDPDLSDFASLKKPITHITDCIHVRDWVFYLRDLKIFYNIYILRILCMFKTVKTKLEQLNAVMKGPQDYLARSK